MQPFKRQHLILTNTFGTFEIVGMNFLGFTIGTLPSFPHAGVFIFSLQLAPGDGIQQSINFTLIEYVGHLCMHLPARGEGPARPRARIYRTGPAVS